MSLLTRRLIRVLEWTRYATHVVTSLTLVFATVMLGIYLFYEVIEATAAKSLIEGFLRSLAVLLLLWTLAELIETEITFLRGHKISVAVFLEVALIVVIREVILLPVEDPHPAPEVVGVWVLSTLFLGVTYFVVKTRSDGRAAGDGKADENGG